jgi:hypothetical protein
MARYEFKIERNEPSDGFLIIGRNIDGGPTDDRPTMPFVVYEHATPEQAYGVVATSFNALLRYIEEREAVAV